MMEMIMPTEQQVPTTATPVGMWPSDGDAEIDRSGIGGQRLGANDTSLSSDLDAITTMTYAELRLAWRRYYRAVPAKKMSRDILELGIARKIQENRLGGLGAEGFPARA